MANPGIPTSLSHGNPMVDLLREFASTMIASEAEARTSRIAMAAGPVSDELIRTTWEFFADAESRINEIRRAPDFHNEYARFRGLAYSFNCTADINAATDAIINLPDNHKFKTDHRVDFILNDGALTGGLTVGTNVFVRTVATNTLTLTATEGGGADINLTNATGTAEMLVNIKPDLASLRTAIDAALDEIELDLTIRATTYDRSNVVHTYSTRSSVETATLQTKMTDIEALIDVIAA